VFQRKTSGSIVCPSCGSLVGVQDDKCYICGRVNPGLWGFAPMLRALGTDLGFIPLVIGVCSVLYALTLIASGSELQIVGGGMSFLAPSLRVLLWFGMSGAYPVYVQGAWWTLLSASWLHGNLLHIVFNMYWLRRFGADTVELIGPSRGSAAFSSARRPAGFCPGFPSRCYGAPRLRWARRRRSWGCSAPWPTTAARAAAA
jgi:rhomboid protease GluP